MPPAGSALAVTICYVTQPSLVSDVGAQSWGRENSANKAGGAIAGERLKANKVYFVNISFTKQVRHIKLKIIFNKLAHGKSPHS